jgi:hypothetical protein
MRLDDAPEHVCPDCPDHPPLVYSHSVGPSAVDIGAGTDGPPTFHYYKCAMCGGTYLVTASGGTGPHHAAPSEKRQKPVKECVECGGAMHVAMHVAVLATGAIPSRRNAEGRFNRAEESLLTWRCIQCGAQSEFSPEDFWV